MPTDAVTRHSSRHLLRLLDLRKPQTIVSSGSTPSEWQRTSSRAWEETQLSQAAKVPTFDEMMWPTLQALKDSNGSSSNQDLLVKVAQIMNLSEEITSLPHGDGPRTEIE